MKNSYFKIGLVIIFLFILLIGCDQGIGPGNSAKTDEVEISSTNLVAPQGGTGEFTIKISSGNHIGSSVRLDLVNAEDGTKPSGIFIEPTSFTLRSSPFNQNVYIHIDETVLQGKYDLQLIVNISNADYRFLISLNVNPPESNELQANLDRNIFAIFQGEKTTLTLTINTPEHLSGTANLYLDGVPKGVSVEPSTFIIDAMPFSAQITFSASTKSLPSQYKGNLIIEISGDEQYTAEIPLSLLISDLPTKKWMTTSALIEDLELCDDKFVAIGHFGSIFTSSDGVTWEAQNTIGMPNAPVLDNLYNLACGNGVIAAVGEAGYVYTASLPLSVDTQWEVIPLDPGKRLHEIEFGDGVFIIAKGNALYKSTDGRIWSKETAGWSTRSLKYGTKGGSNGIFIAAGYDRVDGPIKEVAYTSNDGGGTWTRHVFRSDDKIDAGNIVDGDGFYLVLGRLNKYAMSENGSYWAVRPYPDFMNDKMSNSCKGARMGFNTIIACDDLYNVSSGRSWKKVFEPDVPLREIAFNKTNWTAVAAPRGAGRVFISKDEGDTWGESGYRFASASPIESGEQPDIHSSFYGNGAYVVAGRKGVIATSKNGFEWDAKQISDTADSNVLNITWFGVAYSSDLDKFVAVGGVGSSRGSNAVRKGYIAWADNSYSWSSDSFKWNLITLPNISSLYSIIYGAGRFVAAGQDGVVLTSYDGAFWEKKVIYDKSIRSIAYGNDAYVATAYDAILSSADAESWNVLPVEGGLAGRICFDGSRFILTGKGKVSFSTDGYSWSEPVDMHMEDGSQMPTYLETLNCNNGLIVAGQASKSFSSIIASTDGVNWKSIIPPAAHEALYGSNFANSDVFVFGQWAGILHTR